MSNSSGIISAPVSMKDVQTVLGDSSTSLAALCTSSKINMWAKYKPIPSNEKFLDIKTSYQGKGYNCGISYSTANTVSGIKALYSDTDNGFSYERPTVYRLADFNGYNHRAVCPILDYTFTTPCVSNSFSCSCSEGVATTTGDTLSLADILNVTDDEVYYFGVALWKEGNTSPSFFKTASSKFFYTVDFKGTTLTEGTYTVVPFLSSVKYTDINTIEQMGTYLPLPNISLKTVKLVSKAASLASLVTLTQNTAQGATITNKDTESHVISLQLRFTSSKDSDAMVIGETQLILNQTLAAGKSTLVGFGSYMESGESYRLILYVDYTIVSRQDVFEDDSTPIG